MRVFQLGKYAPWVFDGGIETNTSYVANALSDKVDMNVVVSNVTRVWEHSRIGGVNYFVLPKLFNFLEAPFTIPFFTLLSTSLPDIIHLNVPNPWFEVFLLAYFLVKGKKTKLIITYHADAPDYTIIHRAADLFRSLYLTPLLNLSDKIIVSSQNYIGGSRNLRAVREKNKIVVIPLGVEANLKAPSVQRIRKKYGLQHERVILFVGRLYRYKGLKYLLGAMKHVIDKIKNVRIVIVGEGVLYGELKNQVDQLELSTYVVFTGRVSDEERNAFYKICDIFVLPSISRAEAFGLSLLEAMTFGKPVISTDIPYSGVTYVNINNLTGLTVKPKDPEELAQGIITLLSNNGLAKELGQNAKLRAVKLFNKQLMVNRIYQLYRNVLNNE